MVENNLFLGYSVLFIELNEYEVPVDFMKKETLWSILLVYFSKNKGTKIFALFQNCANSTVDWNLKFILCIKEHFSRLKKNQDLKKMESTDHYESNHKLIFFLNSSYQKNWEPKRRNILLCKKIYIYTFKIFLQFFSTVEIHRSFSCTQMLSILNNPLSTIS